jgi:hypothetical protein
MRVAISMLEEVGGLPESIVEILTFFRLDFLGIEEKLRSIRFDGLANVVDCLPTKRSTLPSP